MNQADNTPTKKPPTASGIPLIGNIAEFIVARGMPIEFLQKTQQEHGDLVHIKIMNKDAYVVGDPALVHEILVKRVHEFHKMEAIQEKRRGLSRFLGEGILTAGYEAWRPQRKVIQPLMHRKHIENYATIMSSKGDLLLSQWEDGSERDIHADLIQVTMWIIAESMFGLPPEEIPDFEDLILELRKIILGDFISFLPEWITKREAVADNINEQLTSFVQRMVDGRTQTSDSERYDLLSLLLAARDEDGNPMSQELIRDNILTMFFAGHETTANTLAWALFYLSQNPDVLRTLQEEVDQLLDDGRAPTLADLEKLPYTLMVIKETMRIQPTVAVIPRVTTTDTVLGEYTLEANSILFLSPYLLHHDVRFWENPDRYDPTRFTEENEANITKYAYLPFGGGPRVCIGNHFALMEAQILLAQIIRRYQLSVVDGAHIEPERTATTHPKNGLPMHISKR
ncbi:MAG: cytochrome P450 [Phototrophicaceae bacterium]